MFGKMENLSNFICISHAFFILILLFASLNRSIFVNSRTIPALEETIAQKIFSNKIGNLPSRNTEYAQNYMMLLSEPDPLMNYAFRGNKRQFKGNN